MAIAERLRRKMLDQSFRSRVYEESKLRVTEAPAKTPG